MAEDDVVNGEESLGAGPGDGVGTQTGELTPEEKLAEAEAKAAEFLDGWQRARAEFANARKRLERERGEAYLNASVDIASQLLPILDDFDRALNIVPPPIAADPWFQGIELVRRKLQNILLNLNVSNIDALGRPFDPALHEALSSRPTDEHESGTVIEEVQTGYRIGDRVLRPSLVLVAA